MIRALLIALFMSVAGIACCGDHDPKECPVLKVSEAIQKASVTVTVTLQDGRKGRGSGILFLDAKDNVWCLTASHVVGRADTASVEVGQFVNDEQGNETVVEVNATVEKDCPEEDIALLKVGKGVFPGAKFTKFYDDENPPQAQTPVIHCGSLAGVLHHSIVYGRITCVGRHDPDFGYKDQLDLTVIGGSSGGPVFTRDGRYIGMITHCVPPQSRICFMTPIRKIRQWAIQENVWHLFQHDYKPPQSQEDD